MFYHEMTQRWYPDETISDLTEIVRDCISDELGDKLEEITSYGKTGCDSCPINMERWQQVDDITKLMNKLATVRPIVCPETRNLPNNKQHMAVKIKPYKNEYHCPVCELSGRIHNLTPPTKNFYTVCPYCNVRLDWYDVLSAE